MKEGCSVFGQYLVDLVLNHLEIEDVSLCYQIVEKSFQKMDPLLKGLQRL